MKRVCFLSFFKNFPAKNAFFSKHSIIGVFARVKMISWIKVGRPNKTHWGGGKTGFPLENEGGIQAEDN